MEVEEVIDTYKRNYKVEKEILKKFSYLLKKYVSKDEIEKRFELNCENGIYVLKPSIFKEIAYDEYITAFYNKNNKAIFINAKYYKSVPRIGIHEMGHVYLSSFINSKIIFDGVEKECGVGLEEGAVSVLESTNSLENFLFPNVHSYKTQSQSFLQLNELYKNVFGEYPNLLIHLLKENDSICNITNKIYESIIKDDFDITHQSFLAMILGNDILDYKLEYDLNAYNTFINSAYLLLMDLSYRNGEKKDLFLEPSVFYYMNAVRLLKVIFSDDENLDYFDKVKEDISKASEKVLNICYDYK